MKKKPLNRTKAIQEWQKTLESKNVIIDDKDYNTTTFDVSQKVIAALLPSTSQQVSECLQIANKHKIPTYPVSGGKNFGLGSKVPIIDQSVVIDLKGLNTISDYNGEMAYVTVEPGVTFKQLEDYLEEQGGELMMDSIGSTPHASIIGNTVERGHGMGLYADRFAHTCGYKVVLPNGEIIQSGFSGYQKNKLGKLAKGGVGASLDGIFTQSNFGIITELTLWLKPKPSHFQSFMIHLSDDIEMSKAVDEFRKMKLEGLQVSLRIFNDYRLVGFSSQYSQMQTSESSNYISRQDLDRLKSDDIGKWIVIGALYSFSESHAKSEKEFILERLNGAYQSADFWDKKTADTTVQNDPAKKEEMDFFFYKSSLRGYTTEKALNMCYWRMPNPIPETKDIHKDACGLLWYCPTIPCRGEDALIASAIIEKISYKYYLEPNVGFLFISERSLDITGAICFDKNNKTEMENAIKCHDEIMRKLIAVGYPPYRLGIQSMSLFEQMKESNLKLLAQIKNSLDPNNILAGKRYNRN